MSVDMDQARLAEGRLGGTLHVGNGGGEVAWLYPFDPCYDTDVTVTEAGKQVRPDQLAACGRRRAYTDADLVRAPPGGTVAVPFSVLGHYPLRSGHTYRIEVTYRAHTMPDDALSVVPWARPLVSDATVTVA